MDTSGALEAEAEIEEHFRNRPSPDTRSSYHRAQDAMRIGVGAIDPKSTNETSPLLGDDERPSPNDEQPPFESTTYKDFQDLPWYKRPSTYWMLPPFLLFSLAFGGVMVAKVNLVNDLICRDYYRSQALASPGNGTSPPSEPGWGEGNPACDIPAVSRRATPFILGETLLGGLMTSFTSPWLGDLADRYGRTRIIAICSAGGLVREVLLISAANMFDTFPVGLLYLGFFADGLSGGFVAGMAVAHAYATDTTPPAKRNVAFGYFHVCLFTGIAVGPIVGGYVAKATGTTLTMFYVAFACHLVFIAWNLLVVPESVPKWRQKVARERYAHDIASNADSRWYSIFKPKVFFRPLKVLWPVGEGASPALRRNLVLLCAIDTVMFGFAMGVLNVFILYIKVQFHWDQLKQNQFVSIVNTVRVTALFILLPTINRVVRGPSRLLQNKRQEGCDRLDLALIRTGILIEVVGFLGYTIVRDGNLFILCGCIAALGGIAAPTMQAAETKHVPAHRVGALLGATGMLHSLSRLIAPIIFSGVFALTVGHYNQAIYLMLTIGFACAWVATWFLKTGIYLEDENTTVSGSSEDAQDNGEVGRI